MRLNKIATYGMHFWKVIVPAHILGVAALFYLPEHFVSLLVLWFVIGVIGNGVAAHRYFAHEQFETYSVVRWMLGLLATLGAIAPLSHWMIQHREHHIVADSEEDKDSSTNNSMWHIMYEQRFKSGTDTAFYMRKMRVRRIVVKIRKDPLLLFLDRHYFTVIHTFSLILLLINPIWCWMYWLAVCIEFFRIGLVNWFGHGDHIGGYRNHECSDSSSNNLLVGWLGMGFGWHNNHHADPKRLVLTDHWWEVDV